MRSLHPWPLFPSHLTPSAARSLSLQFLLQEFILAFTYLERVQIKFRETGHILSTDAIYNELDQWLLFSVEKPLSQKGGSIDNLCFYSEILIKNSTVEEADIPMFLESLRLSAFRMKSKVLSFHSRDKKGLIDALLALIQESKNHLQQFFSTFPLFFEESREDENILFFLIEQKDKLNRHLGDRTVDKVLNRLFPKGPRELRAALYDGYARRGFLDFFAKHKALIDTLEWEKELCPPSHPKP